MQYMCLIYTAEDADSEGEEGLFYVWTPREITEHLGKDSSDLFCRFYDVGPHGNFEDGRSILHTRIPLEKFAAQENMLRPSRHRVALPRVVTDIVMQIIRTIGDGFFRVPDHDVGVHAFVYGPFMRETVKPCRGRHR